MRRAASTFIVVMLLALGAIVAGMVAGGWMRGWAGGEAPTVGLTTSPGAAGVVVVALMGLLGTIAVGVGRAGSRHAGWVLAGVGLLAWASRTGTASDLERLEGVRIAAAAEGMLWAALLVAWTMAVRRLEGGSVARRAERRAVAAGPILGAAVTMMVSLATVWLIARTGLKGQTLAATTIGGLFGATAGVAAGGRPRLGAAWTAAAGGLAFAAAALVPDLAEAEWFIPLLRPMPGDYAAGAMLGGSLGLAWAGTLLSPTPEGAGGSHAA